MRRVAVRCSRLRLDFLGIERGIDDPVHAVLGVLEARAADRGENGAGQECEPRDFVAVCLRRLHRSRGGADNLPVDARDGFESLARHEEADELSEVLRVEAERDRSLDCEGRKGRDSNQQAYSPICRSSEAH